MEIAQLLAAFDEAFNRRDWHGNVMNCPEGTVPVRRVTLETLTRFETMNDFFANLAAGLPTESRRRYRLRLR